MKNSLEYQSKGYFLLSPVLNKIKSYLPFTSSALGLSEIATIANDIIINKRQFIVELGCGLSTIVLAKIIKDNCLTAKIVSVEHDKQWIEIINNILEKEDISNFVEILYAPLTTHSGQWYDLSIINKLESFESKIDTLLIDGPPAWKNGFTHSRSFAIPELLELLGDEFTIFLDDINREGESLAIKNWSEIIGIPFFINGNMGIIVKGNAYNFIL